MSILLRTVIPPKRSLCWQQWQPRLFTRLCFAASLAVLYPGPTSKVTELLGGQPFHIQSRACSPAVFFFQERGSKVFEMTSESVETGNPENQGVVLLRGQFRPLHQQMLLVPACPCCCPPVTEGRSLALLVWAPARVRATPLSDPLPSPDPASWPVSHHWNRNSLSSHWREAVSPTGSTSLLLWGENL